MEKVLDTIIGKINSQLLLKTEQFYTLSTVRGINDVSNKLNKNFSVISLYFLKSFDRVACNFFFSACESSNMETNSFTCLKLRSTTCNLKLKQVASYLTPLPLCKDFGRGVHSQCCYTLL